MHRRTLLLGILGALIAAGGAWETVSYARLKVDLQRSTDTVTREVAAANRQAAELRARLSASRSRHPAAVRSSAGPAANSESRPSIAPRSQLSTEQRDASRRWIEQAHVAFFARAGLTPEQIDRLITLYEEHQAWSQDYIAALHEQHLRSTSAGAIELKNQEDQRFDAARRDLLGPETAQKLKDYDATEPSRRMVDAIAANVALSDTPLTLPQAQQLQRLLQLADMTASTENPEAWAPVLAQAATFLQPKQLAELRAQAIQAQNWLVIRQLDDLIARSSRPAK